MIDIYIGRYKTLIHMIMKVKNFKYLPLAEQQVLYLKTYELKEKYYRSKKILKAENQEHQKTEALLRKSNRNTNPTFFHIFPVWALRMQGDTYSFRRG